MAFAAHADSARIATHLAGCPACRKVVERLTQDERLLSQLRSVIQAGPGDNERKRIVNICLQAAREVEGGRPISRTKRKPH